MARWLSAWLVLLAWPMAGLLAAESITEQNILPSMLLHCTVCHGARRKEAGLDLRSRAAMLKGGKSGPALVPGKPEQSLMLKRIRAGEMPPFEQIMNVNVKSFTAGEIERLTQWIALGAPEPAAAEDVAGTTANLLVSDEDRKFWSFRPPAPVAMPTVHDTRRLRNPIDAFIQRKLEENGLTLGPETDRLTLMRRAYLDLTGLLPQPEEIQAYLADREPGAYERLIDRLLASPHYGERWGRYWLDLAGYADSDGHFADSVRPFAYRYRDYVIRSFNADKPYDRFLLEQIAGDELADYEHGPVTAEVMDNLIATGFLRMAPDGTNPTELNSVPERLDVIADELEVFGSAVLGLTIQCARCHDHKYDPIPQRDYYRLSAIFKGAFDEYDWLRPYQRMLPQITPEERQKQQAHNAPLSAQYRALRKLVEDQTEPLRQKYREAALARLPEVLRDDLRKMLATPPDKRDAVQKYLAEKFEKGLRFDIYEIRELNAEFKKATDENIRKMEALQDRMLPGGETIVALWDRGDPSPTYIYRKGDPEKPSRRVGPGVPSVLTDGKTPFVVTPPWPGAKKTGRRLALAKWLVRPDHPLTARVMVNRIWKHHFGRGLVATLQNFGQAGARPTHPELLDWLAREFVRQGWSVKAMHRMLMTSTVYRQASTRTPILEKIDPENRLLGRMPLKRMEAEVLYDNLLRVGGRLDPRPFDAPDPVDVRPDGLVTPLGTERGFRRSVYLLQRRKAASRN